MVSTSPHPQYRTRGGGASIFFCIYLIIACNIDFFIAGCPLNILKKYGKYEIFLGENMGQIWDFWGHFEKNMGQLWDILKIFMWHKFVLSPVSCILEPYNTCRHLP